MIYPIYFYNGRFCANCSAENTMYYENQNMKKLFKEPVYPIDFFVCKNCKRRFFVKWIKNEKGEMIPVPCAKATIDNFENTISIYAKQHERSLEGYLEET